MLGPDAHAPPASSPGNEVAQELSKGDHVLFQEGPGKYEGDVNGVCIRRAASPEGGGSLEPGVEGVFATGSSMEQAEGGGVVWEVDERWRLKVIAELCKLGVPASYDMVKQNLRRKKRKPAQIGCFTRVFRGDNRFIITDGENGRTWLALVEQPGWAEKRLAYRARLLDYLREQGVFLPFRPLRPRQGRQRSAHLLPFPPRSPFLLLLLSPLMYVPR